MIILKLDNWVLKIFTLYNRILKRSLGIGQRRRRITHQITGCCGNARTQCSAGGHRS